MPLPPVSPRLSPAAIPVNIKVKENAAINERKARLDTQKTSKNVEEEPPRPKKRKPTLEKEPQEEGQDARPHPEEQEEAPRLKKRKQSTSENLQDKTGEVNSCTSVQDESLLSAEEFQKKFQISTPCTDACLPQPVQRFDQAPFSKKVRKALMDAGFAMPTPIQAQSWPIMVGGQDLVGVAKTGSGKTLGFLLPAFRFVAERISAALETDGKVTQIAEPMVLVLAPTRELATQIEVECSKFGPLFKLKSQVVYGGAPKGPQVQALKSNPQVLVATPGRLQDLMDMGVVRLKNVQFLVLDEADRMLDMGFEPEISKICDTTHSERQTVLFTATWPKAVQKIAAKYFRQDYAHVNVGQIELSANTAVSQEFFKLDDDEKEAKLWRILDGLPDDAKLICFTNTKRRADALVKAFGSRGYDAVALHGDKAQWERDRDLAKFSTGQCWLLFATDVCARGLDIQGVTHVVNYDMARDVEGYVHRIGRTGRAGATGVSITFWNEAYDMECAPALVKIAQEANQEVPSWLMKAATKTTEVKNKAWRY